MHLALHRSDRATSIAILLGSIPILLPGIVCLPAPWLRGGVCTGIKGPKDQGLSTWVSYKLPHVSPCAGCSISTRSRAHAPPG